jgi:hypothetical protein
MPIKGRRDEVILLRGKGKVSAFQDPWDVPALNLKGNLFNFIVVIISSTTLAYVGGKGGDN